MTFAPVASTRRRRSRLPLLVGAVVVLALVVAVVVYATRSTPPSYRLTAASRATVDQTLPATGTVSPINSAQLNFAVAGTVATVPAVVGQPVAAGQTLATLDPGSLNAALAQAQSGLATAQNKLADDQTGQTSAGDSGTGGAAGSGAAAGSGSGSGSGAGSGAGGSGSGTSGAGGAASSAVAAGTGAVTGALTAGTGAAGGAASSASGAGSGAAGSSNAAVTDLQAKLLADQHRADGDLAAARADVAGASATCPAAMTAALTSAGPAGGGASGGGASGGGSSGGGSPSTPPMTTSDPNPATTTDPNPPTTTDPSSTTPHPAASSGTNASPAAYRPSGGGISGGTGSSGSGGGAGAIQTCLHDLTASLAAQSTVGSDQAAVAADEAALDKALGTLLSASRTAGSGSSTGSAAKAPSAGSAASAARVPSTGSGASTGAKPATTPTPASADQLAADQASVDADNAAVATAQQQLDQASMLSPLTGTVVAVNLTAGQQVSASGTSGTPQISVSGPGGEQVTTTIDNTKIASVHPGQTATATPDGSVSPLTGHVITVGLLPTTELPASALPGGTASTSSANGTSYPVTVALDPIPQPLPDGQNASVSISVARAANVLTVPTSTVRTLGTRHVVTVMRDGRTANAPVTVGAADGVHTEILSGLQPGDQVVLANLATPLPTTTTSTRGATGGGGGFGGGGAGGGGGPRGGG